MVSAAMAWVRAARPELTPDRVVQAVRLTARDVARAGLGRPDRLRRARRRGRAERARGQAADPGPAGAQRQPRVGQRQGVRQARRAAVVGREGRAHQRACWTCRRTRSTPTGSSSARGKTAKLSVIPRFGDPSLEVFHSSAISVNDEDSRVAFSDLRGLEEDRARHGAQPRDQEALLLRRRPPAGQLALPGARVHLAHRLTPRLVSAHAARGPARPGRAAGRRRARPGGPDARDGRRRRRPRVRGRQRRRALPRAAGRDADAGRRDAGAGARGGGPQRGRAARRLRPRDATTRSIATIQTGDAWSAWVPLGTQLAGPPEALVNSDGRLEVFARGAGNVRSTTRTSSCRAGHGRAGRRSATRPSPATRSASVTASAA